MERFIKYIDSALPNRQGDAILYKFKKKTLDDMFARANELTSRGLTDENVVSDLIIDEYSSVADDFKKYEKEKKKQKRRKQFLIGNIIGSLAYVIALVVLFLGISFSTREWGQTWVIMVDGILVLTVYLIAIIINRVMEMKRIFHFIARLLIAMDIVIISVAVFIFTMAILHIPTSWVIIFGGLFAMFLADGVFSSVTKQRLAIINWLIYVPAMSAMLYVIMGALSLVAWSVGWIMIPLSVIIDIVIVIAAIQRNKNVKQEVIDEWKEN